MTVPGPGPTGRGRPRPDTERYAAAERIHAAHPGWMVLWGEYTRLYWAVACRTEQRLILHDTDPERLFTAIRQAEADHRL